MAIILALEAVTKKLFSVVTNHYLKLFIITSFISLLDPFLTSFLLPFDLSLVLLFFSLDFLDDFSLPFFSFFVFDAISTISMGSTFGLGKK